MTAAATITAGVAIVVLAVAAIDLGAAGRWFDLALLVVGTTLLVAAQVLRITARRRPGSGGRDAWRQRGETVDSEQRSC